MNTNQIERIKNSEYWRDDFVIEQVEVQNGLPVYRVSAKDQDDKTLLAILKLNELLQKS